MSAFANDLRSSIRALTAAPSYSIITICCLALGLGGNATIFGVTDSLFFRPPGLVTDPHAVRRLFFQLHPKGPGEITTDLTSFPIHESLADGRSSFRDAAAY